MALHWGSVLVKAAPFFIMGSPPAYEHNNKSVYWHRGAAVSNSSLPHTCTRSGLCFRRTSSDQRHACSLLQNKRLLFCGDSYVRHAYEGLALILTGDYSNGAIPHDPECADEAQFEEKVCRLRVPHQIHACGVELHLRYDAWCEISPVDATHYDAIIWGFGNHPVNGDYGTFYGVHDAAVVRSSKLERLCNAADFRASTGPKTVFLNNHCRQDDALMHQQHPHSTNARVRQFVLSTTAHLHDICNITRYIDTYNMTRQLIDLDPIGARLLTYDGVHWGRLVNVVKGWMLADTL